MSKSILQWFLWTFKAIELEDLKGEMETANEMSNRYVAESVSRVTGGKEGQITRLAGGRYAKRGGKAHT